MERHGIGKGFWKPVGLGTSTGLMNLYTFCKLSSTRASCKTTAAFRSGFFFNQFKLVLPRHVSARCKSWDCSRCGKGLARFHLPHTISHPPLQTAEVFVPNKSSILHLGGSLLIWRRYFLRSEQDQYLVASWPLLQVFSIAYS